MAVLIGASSAILAGAFVTVAIGFPTFQGVNNVGFQLDGDVSAATNATPTNPYDWSSLFTAGTTVASPGGAAVNPLPTGFSSARLVRDFQTTATGGFSKADSSTFATGSKDILNIGAIPATGSTGATAAGWQCSPANNLLDKDDIMNAYAAAYVDPGSGDHILYFGLERNGNAGDENVAFWFLQKPASCSSAKGAVDFTGAHSDGDLLIVSAFTKGGSVSTINAYRWNGGADGSLGTTPIGSGGDCTTAPAGAAICARANDAVITTPWLTANDATHTEIGNTLQPGEFFEGGIDVDQFPQLSGKCFNDFLGDTRSSQSLTATLFDFANGQIGECTSSTTTHPVAADGTTALTTAAIPAAPADAAVSVKDSADISVTGVNSFNGTVTYFLCGPSDTGTCDTGGVNIGSTAVTVSTTGLTSPTATVTAAGRYCFRAEFSGDSAIGVPPSSDHSATECFTVTPVQPTLSTTASAGPVSFGSKISDTADLEGTANEPGTGGTSVASINPTALGGPAQGQITVTAFGPDSCSTVALPAVTLDVNGNGQYGGTGSATEFTPGSPGTYVFVASYGGDSPNTLGVAATACANQPGAEKVVVRQIPTQISTHQKVYPQDSATITSSIVADSLPTAGTVTFRLYGPTGSATASQNCLAHGDTIGSGGLLYRQAANPVAGGNSFTVGTSNTTVAVDTNDTFYWRVTYAPGDQAHTGSQSDCVENTTTAFVNDIGPGVLFP
ncbi:MAG TPA: hypothetical protein VG388_03155 [Solirubrobacteraceae bacterium]|nr:hypothetical protein [Solirubrobacteraceae bacterium]